MAELVACPEEGCDQPAEILDEYTLPVIGETDSIVLMRRTGCLRRHFIDLPIVFQ